MTTSHLTHEPGSQLKIRRLALDLIPYEHHGIYVDDHEVIEFAGGDLFEMGATEIRTASLPAFEKGGKAEVVQHPIKWMGLTYSPAGPPELIVDRARWLIKNQPPAYWVAHRNCEYIANWCATGYFESFQTKRFMGAKAVVFSLPLLLSMRALSPRAARTVGAVSIGITLVTAVPYQLDSRLPRHLRTYPGLGAW